MYKRQTTYSAPIGDLIVAFCTHFIFRKSHERTAPNAEQKFFTKSKTELGAFLPKAQYTRVKLRMSTYIIIIIIIINRDGDDDD